MTHSTDVSGRAEIVVATIDLDAELAFFTETAGFRIESVFPADGPRVAVVSGYGVRLRLDTEAEAAPATLRLESEHAYPGEWRALVAPNGTVIEIALDGTRTQTNKDGTVITSYLDGSKRQQNKDGKVIETTVDGEQVQTNPDGTRIVLNSKDSGCGCLGL